MPEPVKFGPGREEAFRQYIDVELREALDWHQKLVDIWIKWLNQYRAPAQQPTRRFPYEGAANFELPMTAIDVDQLYARFLQTIHAPDNLWTLGPLNEKWVNSAKPMTDILTFLDKQVVRMFDVNKRAILEMVKLGTAIWKTGWVYEKRPTWTYDTAGVISKFDLIRGAPFVDHVKLADFVLPPDSFAIQPDEQGGAPWVAERLRVKPAKLRMMGTSSEPFLPNINPDDLEKVLRYEEPGPTDHTAAVMHHDYDKTSTGSRGMDFDKDSGTLADTSGGKPAPGRQGRDIELWEVHARFPTRDAKAVDDIIVWYHDPTRTILRPVYNYFLHGKRPYEVARFFPGEGFYGIGVCEQKEVFQRAGSELFNFTYDNVLLANSRMIVARSGSNIGPGEPIYPWKIWITDDDVNKSFGVFPMADIYPSLPGLSAQVEGMGQRRTSIGDVQLGNIDQLPGRTPATTMMSLLQEGNRRPDLTVKELRTTLGTIGLRLIQLIQQYASAPVDVGGQALMQILVQTLGMPEGPEVASKLLAIPAENAEFGLGVSITATSGSTNKEVERQNFLALLQLAAQLYPQFVQGLAMVPQLAATNPQAAEAALRSANGLQELFKRLLEQYDVRNMEDILPLPDHVQQQQQIAPVNGAGAPAGAVPASFDPQLAALFSGVQGGL